MSVQRKSNPPDEPDLDSTAELPVLDLAACEATMTDQALSATDTWIIPTSMLPAAQPAASIEGERGKPELEEAQAERAAAQELARVLDAQVAQLKQANESHGAELQRATEARDAAERLLKLREQELQTERAAHGRDLQTQQTERERELRLQLDESNRAFATAQEDARGREARMAGYLETLQSMESRRALLEGELSGMEGELQERDAQIARLGRELDAKTLRVSELTADLAAREKRIAAVEREVSSLGAALAERNEQLVNSERAQQKLHDSIARLTEAIAARSERASELEMAATQRDVSLAELRHEIRRLSHERDALQARVNALEAELTAAKTQTTEQGDAVHTRLAQQEEIARAAEAARAESEAELALAKQRGDELAGELIGARRQLEERTAALRTALGERDAKLAAQSAAHAALEARVRELEAAQNKRLEGGASHGTYETMPEGAVRLLIRTDGDTEVVHVLGRKTTIGRAPESDVQIDAKFISRNHAMILAGPNYTIIEDLNSTNGVLVNNRRVTRHTLQDGDSVAIGRTQFRFAVRPSRAA